MTAEEGGYRVSVCYRPIGVPADDCAWASGEPMLIPLAEGVVSR